MSILSIPDQRIELRDPRAIRERLAGFGIAFEQWETVALDANAGQDEILAAYAGVLNPYMDARGYRTADVIRIDDATPGLPAIRAKFIKEHTHTEDEVRFFVDGRGEFWFNIGGEAPVLCVLCERGDLIAVPAGTRHWFDAGEAPFVKAIRLFTDASGWVPHYTGSGIAARYKPGLPDIAV